MPSLVPDEDVRLARAAHARLAETLAAVEADDALARQPSLLPGWSVGHVLSHLARNADSHVRALDGARRGVPVDRYPAGAAGREADIAAGAGRPMAELVADVRTSSAALAARWSALSPAAWAVVGSSQGAREPVRELPAKRRREVELHHVDLGLPGYGPDDWPADFVALELRRAEMAWRAARPMGLTALPAGALALAPARRLAWLAGRLAVDGLPTPPRWP
jgi:maleylpyruvate isomerase